MRVAMSELGHLQTSAKPDGMSVCHPRAGIKVPAVLPRPDALPMVPAELAPTPGVRAAKDGWIEVVATSPAKIVVIMVLRIAISLFRTSGMHWSRYPRWFWDRVKCWFRCKLGRQGR